MRIVAGRHRGRTLLVPPGTNVRPTSDRARESLFNILQSRQPLADAVFLDLFAGSGAVGLEALSRGAGRAVFFEQASISLSALKQNIAALREEARSTVVPGDASKAGPRPAALPPADLVFLDPPYHSGLIPPALTALLGGGWLAEDAVIVAEVAAKEELLPPQGFLAKDERRYGAAKFVFLGRTDG